MTELSDLHVHLGGAVPAAVLWEILCNQGLQTEYKGFQDFQTALTAAAGQIKNLDEFLGKYFHVTEAIQSSPDAIATSAYQAISKAFRRSQIAYMEIRFNPAKRLRAGLHNMDAIVLATLQGLERASLHYGVKTAAIFSLGRDCPQTTNASILEAAIRWKKPAMGTAAGIVGIDMAGPESLHREKDPEWVSQTADLFQKAKAAGLKTTYHIGETPDSGWRGLRTILNQIRPDRIGHGIELRNAPKQKKEEILQTLAATRTCLEICPTVNAVTGYAQTEDLQAFCTELASRAAPFCICTDNPYLVHTNVQAEMDRVFPSNCHAKEWALENSKLHRFS